MLHVDCSRGYNVNRTWPATVWSSGWHWRYLLKILTWPPKQWRQVKNKYFVYKPSTAIRLYQREVRTKYILGGRSNVLALQNILRNLKMLNIKEVTKRVLNPVSFLQYQWMCVYYSYMNVKTQRSRQEQLRLIYLTNEKHTLTWG